MINYADYDFYKNYYQGSLSFDLFNSLLPKASREIDKAVNKKLEENDIDDRVKFVTCELVDYLNNTGGYSGKNSNVSTIIIDGVHKTFNNKNSNEVKRDIKQITNGLPLELIRWI